uniref:hypothetical protein n=1 Tax=Pedobacter schmidteae TaxID=2201271 RepID=UPI000EB5AD7D|nr:hypothetical protein [Pedobacter schmidteae]
MENSANEKNQDIKQRFVGRHVKSRVTAMVEYILQSAENFEIKPFSYDNIENIWVFVSSEGIEYPGKSGKEMLAQLSKELHNLESSVSTATDHEIVLLTEKIKNFEQGYETYREVLEWWTVSDFLGKKLQEFGYVILTDGDNYIWGRTQQDYEIWDDKCIGVICNDMEILEGQINAIP